MLLSVSIAQDAEPNLATWTAWLSTRAPWDVLKLDVRLESVFRSHSTLVLISIPISGWNLLAERPAYKFVGFVRSGNLVARMEDLRSERTEKRRRSKRLGKGRRDHDLLGQTAAGTPRQKKAVRSERRKPLESKNQLETPPHSFHSDKADLLQLTRKPLESRNEVEIPPHSWTPVKDDLLKSARRQGLNWQPIASQYFPNKSANACRKRHERLMEKSNSCAPSDAAFNGDNDEMKFLREKYSLNRQQMWEHVAEKIGVDWEVCEAKVLGISQAPFDTIWLMYGP